MTENLFEAQYDLTKKSKFRKFYEAYKILIISTISISVILLASIFYYLDKKEKKRILLSENYVQAKIYLNEGKNKIATEILKKIILSKDSTYSTLSFFIILDKNLVNEEETRNLFNYLHETNKYDGEKYSIFLARMVAYTLGKLISTNSALSYICCKNLCKSLGWDAGPPWLPATPLAIATSNIWAVL